MRRHDRLTEPGEIADNLALAGITFELADYGRLAVTCHCAGSYGDCGGRLTRGSRIFPKFRGFSREMAPHVPRPPPNFFQLPPPGGSEKIELRPRNVRRALN